jgi:hypothetical protein
MYGDWVLSYPDTEYRFGPQARGVELRGWAFAADSFRVDDASMPRRDGVAFGRDYVDAGELRIELLIDFTDHPAPPEVCAQMAWDARMGLASTWRADTLRGRPREVAELVMGGQQMIEGRPRRVSFDDKHQGRGLIYASATFLPSSTTVYVVDESGVAPWREQTVGLVPALVGGGLVAPLVAPLSTAVESTRAAPFTVGGDTDVWPVITVQGPIQSGAQVELTGRWALKLNRALAYDEVATIDTRPGRRLMEVNGRGGNILSPSSVPLSQASIPPGLNQVALRGASVEGTATASIRWREQKAG